MHHRSLLRRSSTLGIGILALAQVWSCNRRSELELEPPQSQPAPLTQPDPAKPAAGERPFTPAWPPPPGAQIPIDNTPRQAREGWSKLTLEDTLPLCIFANQTERDNAQLIERVKPQKLEANTHLVFGVFGPWCLNKDCDEYPTLQCWIDDERDTLVLHTRFHSTHKDESKCTTDCMELDTSCETPQLAPGKYKIRHGEKTYTLRIPSTMRSPCLK